MASEVLIGILPQVTNGHPMDTQWTPNGHPNGHPMDTTFFQAIRVLAIKESLRIKTIS